MTDPGKPIEVDTEEKNKEEEEKDVFELTPKIDDAVTTIPLLELAQQRFLLSLDDELCSGEEKAGIREKLQEGIKKDEMTPWLRALTQQFGWMEDSSLQQQLDEANATELKKIDATIADAEENLGETEVRLAFLLKKKALEAYEAAMSKIVGVGGKMENAFAQIRLGLFFEDHEAIKKGIALMKGFCQQKDSDWERRNRLKVYEATYLMSIRQYRQAAELFVSTLATFSATELLTHSRFVYYTVVMALVALDRETIRDKVLYAPEVLGVVNEFESLADLLNGFYHGEYARFLQALAVITDQFKRDMYLSAHAGHFCREMRVCAYAQFLESYRSVTIESMAKTFGVTPEFLDKEISRFVAAGRLFCKIDKVAGVVETTRPDQKTGLYYDGLKAGDHLLNRVQKLARVINM